MLRLILRAPRKLGATVAMSLIVLAGCASVPPETVELSHAIGQDMEELHRSHRALAELQFSQAKDRVNTFIDGIYRPALIETTADEAGLVSNIELILDRDPERLPAYLSRFLTAVDPLVEAKRNELLNPIEEQEQQLLAEINAAYSQVQAANAVISGHLASIRSVHDAQSQALEAVGLPDMRERIAATTADVSNRISDLNRRGLEISSSIDDATTRIQSLNEAITNTFNAGD
jgi:hypothetical protein